MKNPYEIAAIHLVNELLPRFKRAGISIERSPITPMQMGILARLEHSGYWTRYEVRRFLDIIVRR
jgi:hypothetical protein